MENEQALNETVFEILGDDHELVKAIKAEQPVYLSHVLFAVIEKMNERLKLIEERKIH